MRHTFLALAFAVAASTPGDAQTPRPQSAVRFPATPVGLALREWIEAFNSADSIRLGAYYKRYGMQRSLGAQMSFRNRTGGFELLSIETSKPLYMEWVARERATGNLAFGVSELSGGTPAVMRQSGLYPMPQGTTAADFRIDAKTRRQVIDEAIAKLDSNYVFPDVATKMAQAVRDRQKRGEYDEVTNGIAFANLLTDHFRAVSRDGHLRVNFNAGGVPQRQGEPDARARESYRQQLLRDNCGFRQAEKQPGNVGYLKFDFFADPEFCGEVATRMLTSLAGVDALIIDLRENGGGDPAMVAHISSYLFSKRTHLNDIWERPRNRTEEYWTNPALPGAKIGDSVPVFVLTANRTFSGAEEFSYNLKNLRRATIVGETTGGGAHPVNGHPIAGRFMIGVPFARAINPITKTNWEGTGVEPDVKVPAGDALATARRLIAERAKAAP